jgi:hypothetical protein
LTETAEPSRLPPCPTCVAEVTAVSQDERFGVVMLVLQPCGHRIVGVEAAQAYWKRAT